MIKDLSKVQELENLYSQKKDQFLNIKESINKEFYSLLYFYKDYQKKLEDDRETKNITYEEIEDFAKESDKFCKLMDKNLENFDQELQLIKNEISNIENSLQDLYKANNIEPKINFLTKEDREVKKKFDHNEEKQILQAQIFIFLNKRNRFDDKKKKETQKETHIDGKSNQTSRNDENNKLNFEDSSVIVSNQEKEKNYNKSNLIKKIFLQFILTSAIISALYITDQKLNFIERISKQKSIFYCITGVFGFCLSFFISDRIIPKTKCEFKNTNSEQLSLKLNSSSTHNP